VHHGHRRDAGPDLPAEHPLILYAAAAGSRLKLLIAGITLPRHCRLPLSPDLVLRPEIQLPEGYTGDPLEKLRIVVVALPACAIPVILVAGLLLGWFGPTELAAFTIGCGFLVGGAIYRELTWKKCVESAKETVRATATIMFIVSSSALFAWALTVEQVPDQVSSLMLGISNNPYVLLLIVNAILLVVGMFMESISAIMVMTPLIVPPLHAAGVDPIHLGMVVVFNLMIGLLTPPVGMSLYMVSIVSGVPFTRSRR
jgi:tripartite ATP-independent transporter DctM subunit